jgi:hypothetical protein
MRTADSKACIRSCETAPTSRNWALLYTLRSGEADYVTFLTTFIWHNLPMRDHIVIIVTKIFVENDFFK